MVKSTNLLSNIELLWRNLRHFAYRNGTIFEFLFIFAYFSEQALLIILSYTWPEHISLFIGFFALLIITTAALQKLVMQSRIKMLEAKVVEIESGKDRLKNDAEYLKFKLELALKALQQPVSFQNKKI